MTVVLLILLVVLVAVNGLFVAAEIGLVRSRRARLETLAQEGERGAQQAMEQIDRIAEFVAACQVGITLCSIGIGFLGEPAFAGLLRPAFGGLSHALATAIALGIAFAIVTSLHITFGELVPKLMAISRTEGAARRLAGPLGAFRRVSAPVTLGLSAVANRVVRMFGVHTDELTADPTSEDIKVLIAQSSTGGVLDPGEAVMLTGVFHLHEQEAREVMTPIPAVVTVDVSDTVETALKRCVSSGHTRLVVIEDENPDKVKGIVHNNSLARLYMNEGAEASIEGAIREAPIVPETRPLDDLLQDLQRQRTSMAIVVDEYGRTIGIVTVEDILEEVVGEIEDETDPLAAAIRRLTNGDWFVRGHVSLGDLHDAGIDLPVDTEAFNSVGGYVFNELGRLPKRGDSITADGYTIRVESVRENRIEALRIRASAAAGAPG
ncbi:MAG: magnesium and cobalt exporter, family [Solirubrobacterales bacterium]|jgi:CBS domain containing-hemolysin-like protein|nr:magnesium and cobalt exporter, family [Solirubrobacterales bacterium]